MFYCFATIAPVFDTAIPLCLPGRRESGHVVRRKDTAEFQEMLLADGIFEPDTVPRIDGSLLCREFLEGNGFRFPRIVKPVERIEGMRMPKALTVDKIAELVGPDVVMPVLDVGPQEELSMTLAAWVSYWHDPGRSRRLNVTSLEITGTPLAELVRPPLAVRQIDWIETVWPPQLRLESLARLSEANQLAGSKFGVTDRDAEVKRLADKAQTAAARSGAEEKAEGEPEVTPKNSGKVPHDCRGHSENGSDLKLADSNETTEEAEENEDNDENGAAENDDADVDAANDGTGALILYAQKLHDGVQLAAARLGAHVEGRTEKREREAAQLAKEKEKRREATKLYLSRLQATAEKELSRVQAVQRQKHAPMRGVKTGEIRQPLQATKSGEEGEVAATASPQRQLVQSWLWECAVVKRSTSKQKRKQQEEEAGAWNGGSGPPADPTLLPTTAELRSWDKVSQ
eukprot:COSAG05_NODE_88_length_20344_cov_12.094690_7_plen_458_part_00